MHSKQQACACNYCDYQTNRRDNLNRHLNSKHGIWKLVESLLQDVIESVITDVSKDSQNDEQEEDEIEKNVNEIQGESLYVQMRNRRVAEIQAAFREKFPNFEQEVRSLKVAKKKVSRGKIKSGTLAPITTRRSSRFGASAPGRMADIATDNTLTNQMYEGQPWVTSVEAGDVDLGEGDRGGGVITEHRSNGFVGQQGQGDYDFGNGIGEPEDGGDVGALGKHGCVTCNMSFRDVRKHEERSSPVACPRTWCTAEFSILADMIRHKATCLMMCPYPNCHKGFKYEKVFAAHRRGHLTRDRRMSD